MIDSMFLYKNRHTSGGRLSSRSLLFPWRRHTVIFLILLSLFVMCNLINYLHTARYFTYRALLDERTFETESHQHSFNSTCNRGADRRGPHQRVVAYTIFGNFSRQDVVNKYLKPSFTETIDQISSLYPGWIVRIYHNLTKDDAGSLPWKFLENTLQFDHVDLCNATEIVEKQQLGDLFAMTWRWLPLLDEMVDAFMSRDSDSRIIPREVEAVGAWLASNKTFHIMRDHPGQCLFGYNPILGGMWGAKVNEDRSRIFRSFQKIFHSDHEHRYDYDQELLLKYVWPIAKENMIAHDSYCCEKFPGPNQPFPTHRKDGLFVGGRELPEEELKKPCPLQCRPTSATSPDWDFC